jgi:hypothetical protein
MSSSPASKHVQNKPVQNPPGSAADRLHSPAALLAARDRTAAFLTRLASALEARPLLCFLLLTLFIAIGLLDRSLSRPLWHDELFTFYIAQAPTLPELLRDTRIIDLNPPLSYLLTRASFALFGINDLTCRLPEMAGFLLALLSLFLFVRRRAGTLYGLLAALLFFTGSAGTLAAEARPYGLLLGFAALSLLAWQKARDHDRLALPLLCLGGFGMLLSHVFGLILWGLFAAVEFVKVLRCGSIEWRLVAAWLLPLICTVTYIPILRTHGHMIFPAAYQPGLHTAFDFYDTWLEREARILLLTGLILALLFGRRTLQKSSPSAFTQTDWLTALFLFAFPVVILVQFIRSHAAFFPRYGAAGNLGLCLLTVMLLAWWTARDTRAALLCLALVLWSSGQLPPTLKALRRHRIFTSAAPTPEFCEPCALSARIDPSVPFVDASGLTFLEMDHREDDAMDRRLFYLTDPTASTQYAHTNIFESMALEKSLFPIRANVSTYASFTRAHHRFFVFGRYDYPEDWLLRKLLADGASLRLVAETTSSYRDKDLYLVTL